ncbi:MAG: bifunctional transaldolase/phosoglucose isomerase [Brevefilum sp.]|nr:bifunctional transaldolase/phosoglucose isomerase [Brevefilum sp.]
MSNVNKLQLLGQSIWYDNLKRSFIQDGTIQGMIERREILGMTSNPSIFEKAIKSDNDYAADLQMMAWAGLSSEEIFYRLAIRDIQNAADLFRPYYDASNGRDGYVSLEVNPKLADETQDTVDEAKWLWKEVDRPNLMVKIPATKAGLPAITEAISAGINVNVTLIFSRKRYLEVMEAYLAGLEKRLDQGQDVSRIASVASFFVSRLDTKANERLQQIVDEGGAGADQARSLQGKLAIDNTRLAYQAYLDFFAAPRFARLARAGAQKQRPLWASTSTKDPAYSDVLYVDELVAENTVNTVPPETLAAYLDHGDPAIRIDQDLDRAKADFELLSDLGLSLDEITQALEDEGVRKFAESFDGLLEAIEAERRKFLGDLGSLADKVASQVKLFKNGDLVAKIFRNDPTIWTNTSEGKQTVQTRLSWRDLPKTSQAAITEIEGFVKQCRADGLTKALVIGMGGSSLAPETMSLILGPKSEGMSLKIIDSTLPAQVSEIEAWVDYPETIFIVASKSGTTSEPLVLFEYFRGKAEEAVGESWASHFAAITDPGSKLAAIGETSGFRAVFTADPNVGGRYSALTHFGLVPAGLIGIDLHQFLAQAEKMLETCSPMQPMETNLGALLGIILGVSAKHHQDKLTLVADESVAPIEAWLEQLIAESSGKMGKGIVPIADEPQLDAEAYSPDRVFVYLRVSGEKDALIDALRKAQHNVVVLQLADLYDLAAQFYLWEFAVAIACSVLGVNAFDQPDVQDSKDRTKQKLAQFAETGQLAEPDAIWERDGIRVFGQDFEALEDCASISEVIAGFTALAGEGDYIAINAYVPRNEDTIARLTDLRQRILEQTGRATTLGFGPRFLHSTGQLHKGGADNGLFLQITQDHEADLIIPKMDVTFGVLARAQAQGDLEALQSRGRRVIRIHLPTQDPLAF